MLYVVVSDPGGKGISLFNSVILCVSLVKLLQTIFTTEAQRSHREPRRRTLRPDHLNVMTTSTVSFCASGLVTVCAVAWKASERCIWVPINLGSVFNLKSST